MTLLAQLIAKMEGFGLPGALPTRNHNPGDLRHSPHSEHPGDPNAIGVIDNDQDGWADLERQLRIFAMRGLTLGEAIDIFAPPTENNTTNYLNFICSRLGLPPTATVSQALEITDARPS
jgi:hypothetical protein